jgi:hypothetical protein
MKMGNIVSPWRYDAGAYHTPEPENMRLPAISRCAHKGLFSDILVVSTCIQGQSTEPSWVAVPCPFLEVDRVPKRCEWTQNGHPGTRPKRA